MCVLSDLECFSLQVHGLHCGREFLPLQYRSYFRAYPTSTFRDMQRCLIDCRALAPAQIPRVPSSFDAHRARRAHTSSSLRHEFWQCFSFELRVLPLAHPCWF